MIHEVLSMYTIGWSESREFWQKLILLQNLIQLLFLIFLKSQKNVEFKSIHET